MPIDNTNRGSEKAPRTLINIAQLSALWNIPKATLYNWVSQGRLPYVKLGRLLRFDVVAVEAHRESSSITCRKTAMEAAQR